MLDANIESQTQHNFIIAKEDIMKTLHLTIAALLAPAAQAFAASGANQDSGLLTWLFLGFFALIIVAQFVPGLLVIGSVIKGLASSSPAAKNVPH
jgi:phosphoglycerol transferase MdoB-like AlkP superfamily enzyme